MALKYGKDKFPGKAGKNVADLREETGVRAGVVAKN